MKIIFAILLVLFAGALFAVDPPGDSIYISKEEPVVEKKEEVKKETEKKTDSAKKVITLPPPVPVKLPPSVPKTPPAPPPTKIPEEPSVKSQDIYQKALKASINIFCFDKGINSYILGSGAIIHPDGYVLTNGHLAVHFTEADTECVLRRGSPARDFATARVVWLPDQTPKIASGAIPANDAAILKIVSTSDGSKVGDFEYFKMNTSYEVGEGETLYSLNYPTEFLGSETVLKNANLVFSIGTVDKLVTIDSNPSTPEGAYLNGELSAQHGSSGGIFLDSKKGEIAGLFVGLTEGATTADRKQFIFLSSYIDAIIRADKGMGLEMFLSQKP